MLSLASTQNLALFSHYILIFLKLVVNCSTLFFVHLSDELLYFDLSLFETFVSEFESDEPMTQSSVCVIDLHN